MPVIISRSISAFEKLKKAELISTVNQEYPNASGVLKVAIVNLMPTKIDTEYQLLSLLGDTSYDVAVTLVRMESHDSKNVEGEYLTRNYQTIEQINDQRFDGLIVTGAPVEKLDFESVDYWDELIRIFKWADSHVNSTLYLCWAAQAGLWHKYGVPKYLLDKKKFGVFRHSLVNSQYDIVKGFEKVFFAPHSRYTEILKEDVSKVNDLEIVAESPDAGLHMLVSKDGRQIFITGHPEYAPETLKNEYERDLAKGLTISIPQNYFKEDNAKNSIAIDWNGHAKLLHSNWLDILEKLKT